MLDEKERSDEHKKGSEHEELFEDQSGIQFQSPGESGDSSGESSGSSGESGDVDVEEDNYQKTHQNQENYQNQDQLSQISQDVDEKQTQKEGKSLNLLINSSDFLPDLTTGTLLGCITREGKREPIYDAKVEVFFGAPGKRPIFEVKTNSFGEFKVDDLPVGFYSLRVIKDGYIEEEVVNLKLRAGQELKSEVDLKGKTRETGEVFQDVDQKQINKQKQNQISTLTQDVKLKQQQVFLPTINISIIAGGKDLKDLTIGKIIGKIKSAKNGLPLRNIPVEVFYGADTNFPVAQAVSDDEGKYLVDDLPVGYYTVRAKGFDRTAREIINLRVRPGKESEKDIEL